VFGASSSVAVAARAALPASSVATQQTEAVIE
jgi:hypothetical protein